MDHDLNNSFLFALQPLHDWAVNFGGRAAACLGVLFAVFILTMNLFGRRVHQDGLKPPLANCFLQRRQFSKQFCRQPTDRP